MEYYEFITEALEELAKGKWKKVSKDGTIKWREGVEPLSIDTIETRAAEIEAEYKAKEYQRLRKYPKLEEQLAMIYDTIAIGKQLDKNSVWFKAIKAEKERVPKPGGEPKQGLVKKVINKIKGQ